MLREQLGRIAEAERAVAFYRADAEPQARRDIVDRVLTLLRAPGGDGITISAAPRDTVHRLDAFVKIGNGPNTMDALGATYTLADLKVRDARGNLVDSRKKVRLTGWRAGLGGLGCGINPDIIEPAE